MVVITDGGTDWERVAFVICGVELGLAVGCRQRGGCEWSSEDDLVGVCSRPRAIRKKGWREREREEFYLADCLFLQLDTAVHVVAVLLVAVESVD